MDRTFNLIEYFFWRIIALEILYAVLHVPFSYNLPVLFDTTPTLPSPLFVQKSIPTGWYVVGDCCKDARLQFATQHKDVCLQGPYRQLFPLVLGNDCGEALKYRRQSLYIQ